MAIIVSDWFLAPWLTIPSLDSLASETSIWRQPLRQVRIIAALPRVHHVAEALHDFIRYREHRRFAVMDIDSARFLLDGTNLMAA